MTRLTKLISKDVKHIISDDISLRELLTELNRILVVEIEELENTIEYLIQHHGSVQKAVSGFGKELSKKLYGFRYRHVMSCYEKLMLGLTDNRDVEMRLRGLLTAVIEHEAHFDVVKGSTNLVDLTPRICQVFDIWFQDLIHGKSSDDFRLYVDQTFDGSWESFFDGISFYMMVMLTSGLFLRKLREGMTLTDRTHSVLALASKIYYGESLSGKQYQALMAAGIGGSIVFRGMAMTPEQAKRFLSSEVVSRGSSWTAHLDVAVQYGAQVIPHDVVHSLLVHDGNFCIQNVRQLYRLLEQKYEKQDTAPFFVIMDTPRTAKQCISWILQGDSGSAKFLREFTPEISVVDSLDNALTVRNTAATVCVIMSYLVAYEKTFLNLGSEAVDNFLKESLLKNEEIVVSIPEGIKLSSHDTDVIFPVTWKDSSFHLLPVDTVEALVNFMKQEVPENGVSELLWNERQKLTPQRLRLLMNKFEVPKRLYGAIFGLVKK